MERNNKKLWVAAAIIYMMIQSLLTVAVIALQVDAINARQSAIKQREVLKQQSDYQICILLILPQDRTQTAVENCKLKSESE